MTQWMLPVAVLAAVSACGARGQYGEPVEEGEMAVFFGDEQEEERSSAQPSPPHEVPEQPPDAGTLP